MIPTITTKQRDRSDDFTAACEDLQLSSPNGESSLPCSEPTADIQASPFRVALTVHQDRPPSPNPENTTTQCSHAAATEQKLYVQRKKRRGRPHVSNPNPGYHSQNALASNTLISTQSIPKDLPEQILKPHGLNIRTNDGGRGMTRRTHRDTEHCMSVGLPVRD